MPGIDLNRPFRPLRLAILTVSDSRTPETDTSGDTLEQRAKNAGHHVLYRSIVTDDEEELRTKLEGWLARDDVEVIITTGGTGVTGRDITPDVVLALADKEIPGFGELFRWISFKHIGTSTIQSRAVGVVAHGTFIFALPGSTGACRDAWDEILENQLDIRHRPCNFAELMPRLKE
jgi:molybdenum cofactor biosynthesis protein B